MISSATISSMHMMVRRPMGSLKDLIFERNALGIVLLEPRFRGVRICKHLEMIGIPDLFAGLSLVPR
jgi:hypothetical protein